VDLPINNKQMVTGAFGYLNSEKETKQVIVVPASYGKSRIQSILLYLALTQTDKKIRLVFADESIKKRDQKLNLKILKFLEAAGSKYNERVSFEVGIDGSKQWKSGYVFIDELDAVMFEDLENFRKATNHKNLKVVGLTATAFDGQEEGDEKLALELLGYKIYHNSKNMVDFNPTINEHLRLITKDDYA
jgi:hypothetical protein